MSDNDLFFIIKVTLGFVFSVALSLGFAVVVITVKMKSLKRKIMKEHDLTESEFKNMVNLHKETK